MPETKHIEIFHTLVDISNYSGIAIPKPKVYEKQIFDNLTKHLASFVSGEHSLMKRKSTETNLVTFMDKYGKFWTSGRNPMVLENREKFFPGHMTKK